MAKQDQAAIRAAQERLKTAHQLNDGTGGSAAGEAYVKEARATLWRLTGRKS
jgi:hypothetical protein